MYNTHVGSVQDGSIIYFRNSACYYMKVCNLYDGTGGVVNLSHGSFIPTKLLGHYDLDATACEVVARDVSELYESEDN